MQNKIRYLVVIIFFAFAASSCKTNKEIVDSSGEASAYNKSKFEYTLIQAQKQKMLGNIKEAIALFNDCLSIDKNSAVVMYELSKIYEFVADYQLAFDLIKKATQINKQNKWYRMHLAGLYMKTNQIELAIAEYETLLKQFPHEDEFQYDLINLYLNNGRETDALDLLNKIESINGISESISITKIQIYFKKRDKENVIAIINNLIKEYPNDVKYRLLLAEYYYQFGETVIADDLYTKLANDYPDNGLVQISSGNYFKQKALLDKSHQAYIRAFRNMDVDLDAKISVVLVNYSFFDNEQKVRALELLDILKSLYPANPNVVSIYADYLMKNLMFEQAGQLLRTIKEQQKDKYLYWEKILAIDIELNDYRNLYEDSKLATEYFPNQAMFYFYNGFSLFNLAKYLDAIDVLDIGLNYVVNNRDLEAQFHTFLGESYFRINRFDDAFAAFDKVLKLKPNDDLTLNNYSYYLALQKVNLDKALTMIEKCVALVPNNHTYLDTYAWVLFCLGRYSDALLYIEKSIENSGKSNAVIVEHYGDILYKLNRQDEAVKQWNIAKNIGRGSEFLDKKVATGTFVE